MFDNKRSFWITLAVLLAAIALAAVSDYTQIGNKQSNQCMGYLKKKPGQKEASLSRGSCGDTPSNADTLFNALGKGGPIVDKKSNRCVTAASDKSGASVDGKKCKPVLKKDGKRRRDEDEDNKDNEKAPANDTEVPDFVLNPEKYDWPPEQQWTKISNSSTEFSTSEIWQNGFGWCLEATEDGFFRQRKCDPNNPNQNWFTNFEPQPETPEAPVVQPPVVQPPVVQPPVVQPPVVQPPVVQPPVVQPPVTRPPTPQPQQISCKQFIGTRGCEVFGAFHEVPQAGYEFKYCNGRRDDCIQQCCQVTYQPPVRKPQNCRWHVCPRGSTKASDAASITCDRAIRGDCDSMCCYWVSN